MDEFLGAIASPERRIGVESGDTVYGSDHGEVGTVDKVVETTAEDEGYLLVPRGMIFKTDTYIPLDAVTKRSSTDVFINIPKLVVGEIPWGEPPTRADRQEKQGPPTSGVKKLYGSRSPSVLEGPAKR